jgi:hypothetical protein
MLHKNYIVLAHKNPEQLKRLIEQLNDGLSTFYIHIDKKTDITLFTHLIRSAENIIFIKNRFNVIWCDHSTVEATLETLKEALKIKKKGYCILISGQDFPIKSNEDINSFINKNSKYDFIDIHSIPTEQWYQNGLNRINHYKFNLSAKRGHFVVCPSIHEKTFYSFKNLKSITKLILKLKIKFLLKLLISRKKPEYIKPYGGSQWWCLKNETVEKILAFCEQHKEFRDYHKYTLLSDEIFFQSIIMHIKDIFNLQLKNSLTFVDWERDVPVKPPTFSLNDKELLLNQPDFKLFARKFDQEYDSQIMTFLNSFLNTN